MIWESELDLTTWWESGSPRRKTGHTYRDERHCILTGQEQWSWSTYDFCPVTSLV